jgi:hypothetical protein
MWTVDSFSKGISAWFGSSYPKREQTQDLLTH